MSNLKSFQDQISKVNDQNFEHIALELFRYQAVNNPVYAKYLQALNKDVSGIQKLIEVPFLPISFFKTQEVKTGAWQEEGIFSSSGTTAAQASRHYVRRISNYLQNTQACFEAIYGPIQHYNLFALLPAYLERKDSSLVLMMDHFIKQSQTPFPGFYLYNTADLLRDIDKARQSDKQILLLGVSFALLDLAENTQPDLSDCIIMETGGMKGRRKEITRQELHTVLKQAFRVEVIHAEYGMTELLSQAYAKHNGLFQCPNTMKVFIRDVNDPFSYLPAGRTGGINIIDLANADSCAFIETEDLGKWHEEGYFEVLGRFDQSDVRGCNLLFN